MAVYILLCNAGPLASAGILAGGSEIARSQEETLALIGAKLITQYIVAGSFDLVTVADFPSDEALLAYSLRCNMDGFDTTQLRAFSPEEVDIAVSTLDPLFASDNESETSRNVD